jgi:hypothetical protein
MAAVCPRLLGSIDANRDIASGTNTSTKPHDVWFPTLLSTLFQAMQCRSMAAMQHHGKTAWAVPWWFHGSSNLIAWVTDHLSRHREPPLLVHIQPARKEITLV